MSETKWVCHISGKGAKWEVFKGDVSQYCHVYYSIKDGNTYALPKSEYRLCEPPEQWEDVTAECNIKEAIGFNAIGNTRKRPSIVSCRDGECQRDVFNIIQQQYFRVRKIDGMHNGPAFIIERRRS